MKGATPEDPRHFRTQKAFRTWLEKNHNRVNELFVGFYRKGTGKGGLTYKQALDEALCFGWIDGVRKKVDHERYTNRFTPRTPKSKWSKVNVDRYRELLAEGRVAEPGRAAFARFDASEHEPYSFETPAQELPAPLAARFRKAAGAWAFFQAQAPGYRRVCIHWVVSAKREGTRERRLSKLIEFSAAEQRLPEVSGGPARAAP